jgi:hypothetical protein
MSISQTEKKATALENWKVPAIFVIFVAIAVGLLCLFICAILGWHISRNDGEKPVTLLVELAGMAGGAFLGFLASPKAGEQAAFQIFAKAISAFLSGYALSKIDHLIDTLLQSGTYKDPVVVARLLIFFVAMIISFMIAYSYRAYVQKPHDVGALAIAGIKIADRQLITYVSGGSPPYRYSISSTDPALKTIKDKTSQDGWVVETLEQPFKPGSTLTVDAVDSRNQMVTRRVDFLAAASTATPPGATATPKSPV